MPSATGLPKNVGYILNLEVHLQTRSVGPFAASMSQHCIQERGRVRIAVPCPPPLHIYACMTLLLVIFCGLAVVETRPFACRPYVQKWCTDGALTGLVAALASRAGRNDVLIGQARECRIADRAEVWITQTRWWRYIPPQTLPVPWPPSASRTQARSRQACSWRCRRPSESGPHVPGAS